jgi:hypothetical protein
MLNYQRVINTKHIVLRNIMDFAINNVVLKHQQRVFSAWLEIALRRLRKYMCFMVGS